MPALSRAEVGRWEGLGQAEARPAPRSGPGPGAWLLAGAVALAALLPLSYLVIRFLQADWGFWSLLFHPRTGYLLARTAALVAAVAASAVLLGVPLAWLTARTDLPGRTLWSAVLAIPMAVPSYLVAWCWSAALGPQGLLSRLLGVPLPELHGLPGATLALTLVTYPYVFLAVRSAWLRLDPSWEEAARTLGCSGWSALARVVLPALRPALVSGALLAALYALGDFGGVSFMHYETFTLAIYLQYRSGFDRAYAAGLSLVLAGAALALLVAEARTRRAEAYFRVGAGAERTPPPVPLGRWRGPALALCGLVALAGIGVPLAVIGYWLAAGHDPGGWQELAPRAAASAALSAGAAVAAVLAALPVAWVGARGGGAWARRLQAVVYLNHALPGIVVAFSLVFFAVQLARPLYQTYALLVAAYTLLFLPLADGALRGALSQIRPQLEEAARTLGASSRRVWWAITLPLLRPGLAAAASTVFLAAVKELPATLLLSPAGVQTLATTVWSATSEGFYARAAPAAMLLLALSLASVLALLAAGGGAREGSLPPPSITGSAPGQAGSPWAAARFPGAGGVPARARAGAPALTCRGVVKRFGDTVAVAGANLEVHPGELLCLLGPSGCGKTTLLRLIAGLERLDAGSIYIGGRRVAGPGLHLPPEARRVGLVFQDYALFPHLTVWENAAFGAPGQPQRVQELLRLAGLEEVARRFPHQLSGGQQQRLALVRALAAAPEVLLLDEPFSNLDYALRRRLRQEVRELLRRAGATAVLVTHDQEEALSLADRVAMMWAGRIVQAGPPQEVYFYPATRQVAAFLGEANFLPAEAGGGRVRCPLGTFPAPAWLSGPVEAMFRPELLELEADPAGEGRVEAVAFFGHDQLVTVALPGGLSVQVRVMGAAPCVPGQRVRVRPRGAPMLFPRSAPGEEPLR